MKFSTRDRYALRLMVELANRPNDLIPLKDISDKQRISLKYLEQIVTPLAKAGLASSVRGAQGGYLFTYKRENPGEGDNYFVDVYRFVMDVKEEDLHLQEEETDGHMFATLNQIKEFAAQGKFLHYDSIQAAFENL